MKLLYDRALTTSKKAELNINQKLEPLLFPDRKINYCKQAVCLLPVSSYAIAMCSKDLPAPTVLIGQ